jgi:hypothetical protein
LVTGKSKVGLGVGLPPPALIAAISAETCSASSSPKVHRFALDLVEGALQVLEGQREVEDVDVARGVGREGL